MKLNVPRSLNGNLCDGCYYHAYRRDIRGRESHDCMHSRPHRPLLTAIAECNLFFPDDAKRELDLASIAWSLDLTRRGAGFKAPGGENG
jgi:hypothetical protein